MTLLANDVCSIPLGAPPAVARILYQDDGESISISAMPNRGEPDELTSLRFIGRLCKTLQKRDVPHRVLMRKGSIAEAQVPDRVIVSKVNAKRVPFLHLLHPLEMDKILLES